MNEAKNGGPAFPFVEPSTECNVATGMTLRDYFAAKAMQGYCAREESINHDMADIASDSYAVADAMLREREN
ncbi:MULTISPECIES: hypothetical protein [Burkholderia]|uniref:Gp38 n=1 Tax=Burkholderia pyrrocinia TaxID=60550 RepID=A0A318J478_BURPY|nr:MULTISPECIES: hypothetical protein [Burkholderia]PXX41117.1 hypothetical protein NA66_1001727 [Burkholderia pyrrocinia]SFW58427.1 hypothetical protein SAMN03159384_03043 [Burkholderia sp. NFACC33-1]SFY11860.1 hypothetical protein SAMN03159408_03255 [Burkholderia sp. NFPP32]